MKALARSASNPLFRLSFISAAVEKAKLVAESLSGSATTGVRQRSPLRTGNANAFDWVLGVGIDDGCINKMRGSFAVSLNRSGFLDFPQCGW